MQTSQILSDIKRQKRTNLLETEAKKICADYGIPVPKFGLATNQEEVTETADRIGYPIVLKIVSPEITHKSDVGGVKIGLKNAEDVREAYDEIQKNVKRCSPSANIVGVLVQEMVPTSTEVIVGAIKDPQFGPAVMFGLGGVFVEVLKDVAFRITPVTEEEAREMICEVKAYPLLKGYRTTPPADTEAIVDIIQKTSRLVIEQPEIKELDFNPILVYEHGAKAVDARIILE